MAIEDLLPPDEGLLLPADNSGADLKSSGGKTDDMFDQMSAKVAAGAKILGAKASEIAAEQSPILKEQAQRLGAKMLDAAAQARDRAEEVAREASVTLKDTALRRNFWQNHKRQILFGAGGLIVLLGAGYGFGCYQATKVARDAVESYVIRNHLQQELSYKDISATPFGEVKLSGVKLSNPLSGQPVDVASMRISGLKSDGTVPASLEVGWSGLAVPANALMSGDELAALIGSGFQTLKGEGSFGWRFDPASHDLTLKTVGSFADAGNWEFEAALTNVNPAALGALAPERQNDFVANLLQGGLASLMTVQLKSVSGSLDISGVVKRSREIPHTNMPTDEDQPLFEAIPTKISNELIEAGMNPSDARDTTDALQKFSQTGARISLKSRIDHPVPLFQAGNLFQPQLMTLPAFLAATKITLSN